MDSGFSTRDFAKTGYAAVAVTLVLSAGWSTTALGATSSLVPCDQVARNLTSLEVTVEALSVDMVDHVVNELETGSFESIESEADATDTMAPFLYLTPRVATILRDVFAPDQSLDSDEDVQTSPLADSVIETRSVDATEEDKIDLPRFQRQMYRTDI